MMSRQDNPILVTGGAGFIGSNLVLHWLASERSPVVNLDKLTYAGNLKNLQQVATDSRHIFAHGDICNRPLVADLLARYRPRAIIHLAAESHVDRSIHGPDSFVTTNINGTFCLLEEARAYWMGLPPQDRRSFRFLHISTDEVFGSLGENDLPFSELTAYAPNSPYSASKAASDHMVRAYHRTYELPVLTIHCTNNYGPYQFPEKLIPLMILNAREGKPLPIYGDGKNTRDWLFVSDHCVAISTVLDYGSVGETYNVGGQAERTNLEVVRTICGILDELRPGGPVFPHDSLISFVKDRPGHDRRYAMDARKIEHELGWKPGESFDSGIRKTVEWYLENSEWARDVTSGQYREWIERQYSDR